jgi:hypothetical protein
MSEHIPLPLETPPETTTPTSDPPSLVNTPPAEVKPEEVKPAETPAPVEVVSADDLKEFMPEGADPADPLFKEFIDLSNKSDLSPKARAQELFKLQTKVLEAISEKGSQDFVKMNEKWQDETRNDPEFASGKLEPALGGISKLLDKYGSPETRQAFDFTGAGNHPAIVKFLAKMAKDLNEPGPDPTRIQPPSRPLTQAERLYPNQGKS